MLEKQAPKYRQHKASGRAVVTLSGRDYYLGLYDSEVSKREYDKLVGEWLSHGRRMPDPDGEDGGITIVELIASYWDWVQGYYVKNGRPTSEQTSIRLALAGLRQLYGGTLIGEFGPMKLKSLREHLIGLNCSRGQINRNIDRVRRMFKWAVEHELVPPDVFHGLQAVAGLKKGRSEARETPPVRPISEDFVQTIKPHVNRQVWAMIELQLLTGARSGEVVIMRACDIEMDGPVWLYRPAEHKCEHHNKERTIPLGPKSQTIVREFLKADTATYLFSPRDAENERRAKLHAERQTPLSWGNRPGSNRKRKPKCPPGERYTPSSYRRAIERGCASACPPPDEIKNDPERLKAWQKEHRWHPHQLRHTAGTKTRKLFGLEAAQVHLGHAKADVTQVYAERNLALALDIAAKIG